MNEKYKVEFSLQADKFLSKIDKPLRKKIIRRIEWLAKNCEIINHQPLQYEFKDYFKLKLGKNKNNLQNLSSKENHPDSLYRF